MEQPLPMVLPYLDLRWVLEQEAVCHQGRCLEHFLGLDHFLRDANRHPSRRLRCRQLVTCRETIFVKTAQTKSPTSNSTQTSYPRLLYFIPGIGAGQILMNNMALSQSVQRVHGPYSNS